MKMFIVDDREENLYLLESLLKGSGYEVTSAMNGVEALERLREDSFDMIISDVLMPKMDGFQLCRECKKDDTLRNIPFVFYTATYTEKKDEEFGLSLGAVRYILKPMEPAELIKIIQDVIRELEKGQVKLRKPALDEDKEVFKLYSERLVTKLEKKMLDLEEANKALGKANRAFRVLSGGNQALIRATEETELLRQVCRNVVEVGGYSLAWVGFAEQDKKKTVRPVAHAGYEEGYLETLNLTWADTERGSGPTGKAIRTGKPIINKDIPTNPAFASWRAEALKRGYASSIALPLKANGQTLGALNIYAPEPDAFYEDEVELLTELADDLAYGIMALRTRAERDKAAETLRESQEYARNLIDSSLDMIIAVDNKRRIMEFNHAAEDAFGYHREEVIGKHINILYENPKEGLAVHKQTIMSGHHVQEILNRHRNGKTFPSLLSSSVLRDSSGEVVGVMGVSRDITERKLAEEELQKAHDELEQRVEERTADLAIANEQLKKAKEVAEVATRAKSDFLANMSHELRTPLNAIIGFSEILSDKTFGELNEKQLKYTNNVLTSGNHLLALISDILDLSKVEAGKMELERSTVAVKSLLEDSLVMIKEKAYKHRISLDLRIPDELSDLKFQADERKLKQIVFNLLSNAVKFTPDGGTITVEGRQEKDELIVAVSDTGIGIKHEDLERVFGEFEQVDSSYARQQRGTGLGLALTRSLVELHGGRIRAESEGEGKGSTFTFSIPIKTWEEVGRETEEIIK